MKKIILLSLLIIPAILLAGGHSDSETSRYFMQTGRDNDFCPRLINFIIFAGLIYYLLANPIRSFFRERAKAIASQLAEIENRLKEAKLEKQNAEARIDASEKKSEMIISDAKVEAKLLGEKIIESNKNDLLVLEKQFEEKINLEERKSVRDIIDEVLNENITVDDIKINETKVVDIISKKVA